MSQKIFVYDWELRQVSPTVIIVGHGLTIENKYIMVTILDFLPYCFISNDDDKRNIFRIKNYYKKEVVLMSSSDDINKSDTYVKVYYKDYEKMKLECKGIAHILDIDVIILFLSSHEYPFTGWFELDEHKNIKRYLPEECGMTSPKVLYFDIECISSIGYGMPKAYRRDDIISIISMVFKNYLSGDVKVYLLYVGNISECTSTDSYTSFCFDNEFKLLQKYKEIIIEEDPTIITGYNIFEFDNNYIIDRCKVSLIPFPNISKQNGKTTIRYVSWFSNGYGNNNYPMIDSSGRVYIDMILPFSRLNNGPYSLDYICEKYLGKGKMKGKGISHTEIWKDRTNFKLYCEYCIEDSMLVMKLFEKFNTWNDVCEKASIMSCKIVDIYTRGEQIKILNLFFRECMKLNVVPKHLNTGEWETLKGAHVMEPEPNIYHKCVVLDFQSMYPSIIINYNICPSTHIGKKQFSKEKMGIIPRIAKGLLESRITVKNMMKGESDKIKKIILNFRQLALKICANSLYGALGSKNNQYLGNIECSNTITSIGRDTLQSMCEYIKKKYNMRIIYGDTDSFMLHFDFGFSKELCIIKSQKICNDVNNYLGNNMNLNLESYFDTIIIFKKKQYITIVDENISGKGIVTVKKNYCKYVKSCYIEILEMIRDKKTNIEIKEKIYTFVLDLIDGIIPIDKLIMYKSVKPLDSYRGTSTPQYIMASRLLSEGYDWNSKLEYVYAYEKNKIFLKKRLQGEIMFLIEEIKENKNIQLDYRNYLLHQFIPPFKDLFKLLNMSDLEKEIMLIQ